MSKKRNFWVVLSLFLAFAMVAGTFGPAAAQFVTENGMSIGNTGIFVPTGPFDSDVYFIRRVSKNTGPVHWARNPVELVMETDGVMPFTYVFFELRPWQARAYANGNMDIYTQDPSTGFWNRCPSFLISPSPALTDAGFETAQETLAREGFTGVRIACVATAESVYGIGTTDESALPLILP